MLNVDLFSKNLHLKRDFFWNFDGPIKLLFSKQKPDHFFLLNFDILHLKAVEPWTTKIEKN